MNYCRYHCGRCESHFSSLEAFDAHHQGSGENLIPCAFPDDHALVETEGCCEISDGVARLAQTIYVTARCERAADYFRGSEGRESAPAKPRYPSRSEGRAA
jgi:hypothetical protein